MPQINQKPSFNELIEYLRKAATNTVLDYTKLNQAADTLEAYREALIWCSGSQDFQRGGIAQIGWDRLCRPLLSAETFVNR
jgi:hypothetical protein